MTRTPRLPPGPRLPTLVQTALLARDPVGFMRRCARRHGPVVRVRFVGYPNYVWVADAGLARQVYAADGAGARAGEVRRDFLGHVVGEHSVLCLEGEDWLRQRKLLAPPFHRRHAEGFDADIAAIAAAEIERWPRREPFPLRPRMQAIALEVILRLVFGIADEERLRRLRVLLPRLGEVGGSPAIAILPDWLFGLVERSRLARAVVRPLGRLHRVRDEVDEILYDEIRRRRAEPDREGRDVMTMLLAARDDGGRGLGDVELRDELVTLLEAGHETTATALSWAFERLVRTPRALARLVEEVDAGEEAYLEATVRETLRSRAVVFDTTRRLDAPLELGGYAIPAGWYVAPAVPLVNEDPRVHADPQEFRPERYLGDGASRDGWIPFGGGKRHCLGSHFALLEMKVVIREVVRRLELEAVRVEPERAVLQHVTLVPSEMATVRARPRVREAVAA